LQLFAGRPSATGFSVARHASSLRGCPIKLDSLSYAGLILGTAHLLISMVARKSRFTNSMQALPLVERTSARSPRTRIFCATTFSSSCCRANTFLSSTASLLFLFCCLRLFAQWLTRREFLLVFLSNPAMTALQDPRLACPYLSHGFVIFDNERNSLCP